jgi:hypothetical protein
MRHVRNANGEIAYSVGSGNVFADLGLPNAEQLLAKAELTFHIGRIIQLGNDVEIMVRRKPRGRAKAVVRVVTRKQTGSNAAKTARTRNAR